MRKSRNKIVLRVAYDQAEIDCKISSDPHSYRNLTNTYTHVHAKIIKKILNLGRWSYMGGVGGEGLEMM